nr:ATP-binding cassette domain-containing protein [Bradyrhizobium septentrionale]
MAGSTAIHIRNLVVGFGNKTILNHLNLDVKDGEILGLVGASGGGKSVLMRALSACCRNAAGRSTLSEKSERRWGILFQQEALFLALTARQNVQFPLRENAHLSPRLLDEIADAKLEMVGLTRADGDFSFRTFGWNDEAGGSRTGACVGSRSLVSGRANLRPRSNSSGRIRRLDSDATPDASLHRVHGDARLEQLASDLRPGCRAR